MGETILLVVVLLLALYGCMELIRRIVLRVMGPTKSGGVLLLPISGHCGDVEYLVRSATAQSRWSAELTESILLLDAGMDAETRALAEDVCRQCAGVRVLGREDAAEIEKMFDPPFTRDSNEDIIQ